jgi:hypothetical protein
MLNVDILKLAAEKCISECFPSAEVRFFQNTHSNSYEIMVVYSAKISRFGIWQEKEALEHLNEKRLEIESKIKSEPFVKAMKPEIRVIKRESTLRPRRWVSSLPSSHSKLR